jgi:hypothetical protein
MCIGGGQGIALIFARAELQKPLDVVPALRLDHEVPERRQSIEVEAQALQKQLFLSLL